MNLLTELLLIIATGIAAIAVISAVLAFLLAGVIAMHSRWFWHVIAVQIVVIILITGFAIRYGEDIKATTQPNLFDPFEQSPVPTKCLAQPNQINWCAL